MESNPSSAAAGGKGEPASTPDAMDQAQTRENVGTTWNTDLMETLVERPHRRTVLKGSARDARSFSRGAPMIYDKEPNLVTSSLSGLVDADGVIVELCIYRLEHQSAWTLEAVLPNGTSVVWDDEFPSDLAAYDAFERTLKEEGVSQLLGNVIQFPGT